jgi:hypothetical protein
MGKGTDLLPCRLASSACAPLGWLPFTSRQVIVIIVLNIFVSPHSKDIREHL